MKIGHPHCLPQLQPLLLEPTRRSTASLPPPASSQSSRGRRDRVGNCWSLPAWRIGVIEPPALGVASTSQASDGNRNTLAGTCFPYATVASDLSLSPRPKL